MITIKEDIEGEMLEIYNDDDCIFSGNTWDFRTDAKSLSEFLSDCDVKNQLRKFKYKD